MITWRRGRMEVSTEIALFEMMNKKPEFSINNGS
jgi:hypothetical protein